MLAKKVFLLIVVMAAGYLVYQSIPFNDKLGIQSMQKSAIESDEYQIKIARLQSQIDSLNESYANLEASVKRVDLTLKNQVNDNTTEQKNSADNQQDESLPQRTINDVEVAQAEINKVDSLSSQQKRLEQQAELRALADKLQLAALSVLTDK